MVKAHVIAVIAAASWTSGALAADAAFENHLQSTPMVSPAQIYQIDQLRTDGALGYASDEGTSKPDGGDETKDTSTMTDFFASGIYNVQSIGLRAGLTAWYGSAASEAEMLDPTGTTTDTVKYKADGTRMVLTPQAAMPIGPVVAGVAIDVVQESMKPEDGTAMKGNYTTVRPGVLFANNDVEAGLTWASKTNVKDDADKDDDLAVSSPATLTAHGRYALNRDLAVGGILANRNYSGFDDEVYKNQTVLKATGEMATGPVKIEGDLGYNSAYYKDKDVGLSAATIGTYELGAAADYSINKDATVGGGLGYEFGSDKNDAVEVATNTLTVAVRGNMKF
jgi:hypothetical protein